MLCCSAKSASQFRGPCLLCSTFFFPFSNRCLTDRLMIRPINNYYLFLVTQLEETGTFNDETHKRLHMHLDYKETFYIKTQCTVFSIHSSRLMQCDSSVKPLFWCCSLNSALQGRWQTACQLRGKSCHKPRSLCTLKFQIKNAEWIIFINKSQLLLSFWLHRHYMTCVSAYLCHSPCPSLSPAFMWCARPLHMRSESQIQISRGEEGWSCFVSQQWEDILWLKLCWFRQGHWQNDRIRTEIKLSSWEIMSWLESFTLYGQKYRATQSLNLWIQVFFVLLP